MGIKSWIKSTFSKKSQAIPLTANSINYSGYRYFIDGLGYSYNDKNFSEFVRNGYGQNPFVYAVVEKIADVASTLPRSLKDKDGGEYTLPRSLNNISLEDLLSNPNSQDSCEEFYHKVLSSLLVTGNAIIFSEEAIGMNDISPISEMRIALTQDVVITTVNGKEGGKPLVYQILDHGTYAAEDVLHIKFPNILQETNWGLSPLHAGQAVYTASNDTFTAKAHILKNRGVSGILSAKDANMPILPADQEKLQKDWDSRTAGAERVGGIHFTTAALNYLDVGMSSKDMELLGHNIENLRDVCRIYGIDSSLLGDPANSTYSNREQAERAFYKSVILPISHKIDKKLGPWILEKFSIDNATWSIDIDQIEILNKPDQELSTKVIAEVNSGILSAEEGRAILYPEL